MNLGEVGSLRQAGGECG